LSHFREILQLIPSLKTFFNTLEKGSILFAREIFITRVAIELFANLALGRTRRYGSLKKQSITFKVLDTDYSNGRAVALKVNAAKAGYQELKMLLRLKETGPEPENVIKLLDHFEFSGPNGLHLCMVLELMWMDVGTFVGAQCSSEFKMSVAREVARQVLRGLEVLRSHGITHNGSIQLIHP
jgi:serine/threonine protein kinase